MIISKKYHTLKLADEKCTLLAEFKVDHFGHSENPSNRELVSLEFGSDVINKKNDLRYVIRLDDNDLFEIVSFLKSGMVKLPKKLKDLLK